MTRSRADDTRSRKWRVAAGGVGTPFPAEPSSPHLIVGCLYRDVRNPMYPAFVPAIIGQALLLSRPVLLIYAAVLLAAPVAFAHWLEEPTLADVSASSRRLTTGRCLAGGHACQVEHPDAAPNSPFRTHHRTADLRACPFITGL